MVVSYSKLKMEYYQNFQNYLKPNNGKVMLILEFHHSSITIVNYTCVYYKKHLPIRILGFWMVVSYFKLKMEYYQNFQNYLKPHNGKVMLILEFHHSSITIVNISCVYYKKHLPIQILGFSMRVSYSKLKIECYHTFQNYLKPYDCKVMLILEFQHSSITIVNF